MQHTPSYCTDIKLFLCIISKKKEGSNGLFLTILFLRRAIPAAVFSQPRLAQVGVTEERAIEEYGDIDVYTSNFRPMKATLSGLPDRVFMKIIGFAVVVKTGLKKVDLDNTVGIHRTAEEEFVTMRTPTRKIRQTLPSELGSNDILKSIELERLANKE